MTDNIVELARERQRLFKLKSKRFEEWLAELQDCDIATRRRLAGDLRLRAERAYIAANDAFRQACPDAAKRRVIIEQIELKDALEAKA